MSEYPTNAKELTRQYFDSLWLEQRLMDSGVPETGMKYTGVKDVRSFDASVVHRI